MPHSTLHGFLLITAFKDRVKFFFKFYFLDSVNCMFIVGVYILNGNSHLSRDYQCLLITIVIYLCSQKFWIVTSTLSMATYFSSANSHEMKKTSPFENKYDRQMIFFLFDLMIPFRQKNFTCLIYLGNKNDHDLPAYICGASFIIDELSSRPYFIYV